MIQQVVLDKSEVCTILANHIAASLPPGMTANASVQLWGKHPKAQHRKASDYIREKYLDKRDDKEDLRLLEAGAIVTLTPSQ